MKLTETRPAAAYERVSLQGRLVARVFRVGLLGACDVCALLLAGLLAYLLWALPERGSGADKPYALLVRAMAATGKARVGRFLFRTREHLAALRVAGDVLALHTMFLGQQPTHGGRSRSCCHVDLVTSSPSWARLPAG